MSLYQEIILLQTHFKGIWVAENTIAYYNPLIKPQEVGKHYFWSNFKIPEINKDSRNHNASIEVLSEIKGFNLDKYNIDKRKTLRICVNSKLGLHIFNCAFKEKQQTLK